MTGAAALLASPEALQLLLGAVRLGRLALQQIDLAGMEKLPPEVRRELEAERDQVNAAWARLAPKPADGAPPARVLP